MPGYVIVGMQWGDEGKGKTVDFLTEKADIVVRYQGGNNAGHTVVVNDKETILHLIPCGILHERTTCLIGPGTVIDPAVLLQEIEDLKAADCEVDGRLHISEAAHMIMPYHKIIDGAQERFRGDNKIDTTGRGIGPAYSDKVNRLGIRFGDFLDADAFRQKLRIALEYKNALLTRMFDEEPLDYDTVLKEYAAYADRLRAYSADTVEMLHEAQSEEKMIIFEGAQGAMLDLDHGTFPYVTSSTTMSGGVFGGAGVGPGQIDGVIGILKAYSTRVGEGPLPTELHGDLGERLREAGREYGATTGRPRRCGWLDIVPLRRAAKICGLTHLVLTKSDVLGEFDTLRICTAYEIDGVQTDKFPTVLSQLEKAKPVYEEMPGWKTDISACKSWEEFPREAQDYISRIQELVSAPISVISVGPGREQTIVRNDPFGEAIHPVAASRT